MKIKIILMTVFIMQVFMNSVFGMLVSRSLCGFTCNFSTLLQGQEVINGVNTQIQKLRASILSDNKEDNDAAQQVGYSFPGDVHFTNHFNRSTSRSVAFNCIEDIARSCDESFSIRIGCFLKRYSPAYNGVIDSSFLASLDELVKDLRVMSID